MLGPARDVPQGAQPLLGSEQTEPASRPRRSNRKKWAVLAEAVKRGMHHDPDGTSQTISARTMSPGQ
jgi:hypothetical protein